MRKLLPFAALLACASNTREPTGHTGAALEPRAADGRLDLAPRPPVRAPSISKAIEIDAPTADIAAGAQSGLVTHSDGTNFVLAWTSNIEGAKPIARWQRIAPSGTVLDPIALPLPGAVLGMATTPSASLVVTSVGDAIVATRMGSDGTRLDATQLTIGTGAAPAFVDYDGTQWVVVWDDGAGVRLSHVSPSGVVTNLPAAASSSLPHPLSYASNVFSCTTSGTCLLLMGSDQHAQLIGPSGPIGGAFFAGDPTGYGPRVASAGSDFLHFEFVNVSGFVGLYSRRVSATGGVGSESSLPSLGSSYLSLGGSASGYALAYSNGRDLQVALIPPTGATSPTWNGLVASTGGATGLGLELPARLGTKVLVPWSIVTTKLQAAVFDEASPPAAALPGFAIAKGAAAQTPSAVASDGTGFLVAWVEERGGNLEVRSRHVDATGKALDAAPAVLAPLVKATGGPPISVELAAAFDGTRYHVTWRDNLSALDAPLWEAQLGVDGAPLGPATRLDDGGFVSRAPSVGGGGGKTLIAWVDAGIVFAQHLDPTGKVVEPKPFVVGDTTAGPGDDTRVSVSYDGKRWLVTWPVAAGASTDLAAAFVDGGSTTPATFSVDALPGAQTFPGAASDGKVHLVAWVDVKPGEKTAIRAVRVDATTGKVLDDPPRLVLDDVDQATAASVAWDGATFVVAGVRQGLDEATREIALARVRTDGVVAVEPPWSIAKDVFVRNLVRHVGLASDGKGKTVLALSSMIEALPYVAPRLRLYTFSAQKPAGVACGGVSECDDGFCVDGVCCKTACTGNCEACDVEGSSGTCTPVAGKPHGVRTCGGAGAGGDACTNGACDGKDTTKCAVYALDIGGACTAPTCKGTSYVAASTCSAAHACVAPPTAECAPFRCAPTGCLKTCTGDDQCVDKARCVAGSCVPSPSGARCTDDGLSSVQPDDTVKSCAPYRCDTNGACTPKCATSNDCVPGFVCDGGSGTCVDAGGSGGSSGGCNVVEGRAPRATTVGAFAMLAAIAAFTARRRRTRRPAPLAWSALSLLLLVSCRSSTDAEPASHELVRAHADALKVSSESSTVDATDSIASDLSSIACHSTGCLVVQQRTPWLVGVRLDATGKRLDPVGFVIAPDTIHTGIPELTVGTDGKDFLVMWTQAFRPCAFVRVTGDGKVPAPPKNAVVASTFANHPGVGWDGTTWVLVWGEGISGRGTVDAVRVSAAGDVLDPTALRIFDPASSPSLACDGAGCTVGASVTDTTGVIARFVDGKVVGTASSTTFPLNAVARSGADLVFASFTTTGAIVGSFAVDGTPKIAPKKVTPIAETSGQLASTSSGLVVVSSNAGYGAPRTAVTRLDASLSVVESITVPLLSRTYFGAVNLGGAALFGGTAGTEKVTTGPLAIAPEPLEHRPAPHRFPAVATDGTGHVVAFARSAAGVDAVLVAKVEGGVLAPAAGTLVASEGAPIDDVAIAWDGTSYVVAWITEARVAFARVDATGKVLDAGGIPIAGKRPDGYPYCGIGVGVAPTGAIVMLAGPGVYDVRLTKAGTVLDASPRALTTSATVFACNNLAVANHGGISLVSFGEEGTLEALRVDGDGNALDTPPKILAPASSTSTPQTPVAVADATGWLIAYSHAPTGSLGQDVWMVHAPFDLSAAPGAQWLVSGRDADQLEPSLAVDSGRAVVAWLERAGAHDELRASLVDETAKKVLVDAASITTAGNGELDRPALTAFAGSKGDVVYGRWDADPSILSPRIKARTFTFGGLGSATCSTSADCELGPCVDGVCCNRACDGACESCNEAGSVGTCVTVAGKPRGTRTCGGSGTCAEAICDGFTPRSCGKFAHAFETKCAEPTCSGALFTTIGYCDGRGACAVPTTASCAPFACDPNGCLTTCTTKAGASVGCAEGFLCKDGKCVAPAAGAICADDGLSSRSATDGASKACVPFRCTAEGTCGIKCSSSLECAPGFSCDDSGACVGAGGGGGDSGGCAFVIATAAPDETYSMLGLLTTLLALRRRRAAPRGARPTGRRG